MLFIYYKFGVSAYTLTVMGVTLSARPQNVNSSHLTYVYSKLIIFFIFSQQRIFNQKTNYFQTADSVFPRLN